MTKFTIKNFIDKIKKIKINDGYIIENNDGDVEIYIKGKNMQNASNKISLKSIYDLISNRFDLIDQKFIKIDKRLDCIENDIKELKQLPTIKKELENK